MTLEPGGGMGAAAARRGQGLTQSNRVALTEDMETKESGRNVCKSRVAMCMMSAPAGKGGGGGAFIALIIFASHQI